MKEKITKLISAIDELSNSLAVMKQDPQRNIVLLKKIKAAANEIKKQYDEENAELEALADKIAKEWEVREKEARLFKEEEMKNELQAEIVEPTPGIVSEEETFWAREMREELLADYANDIDGEFELDDDAE